MNASRTAESDDDAALQFNENGDLRHLLSLDGLDASVLLELLDAAERYRTPAGKIPARNRSMAGRTVANLFFEPSTRTRASFDLAARRLGADVLNLDVNTSSRKKGESILDTIYTLEAMHVDVMVVRDASPGVPAYIARNVGGDVCILNAGEGDISHPTQGLLDLLTIRRHKGDFGSLVVAIVGDVQHSRVARSAASGLRTLGVGELRLISPSALAPAANDFPGAIVTTSLKDGLNGADVVMALRIQRERIADIEDIPGTDDYFAQFGISRQSIRYAKADAIVMHPGPMNRGIEIEGAVADGAQSVITEQVSNGVAVRMAVLDRIAQTMRES